jgi:hypothetical protein
MRRKIKIQIDAIAILLMLLFLVGLAAYATAVLIGRHAAG